MFLFSALLCFLFVPVIVATPCTRDDYFGEYTLCRNEPGTPYQIRDALFRLKKGATCNPNEAGSVTVANKLDLRCGMLVAAQPMASVRFGCFFFDRTVFD